MIDVARLLSEKSMVEVTGAVAQNATITLEVTPRQAGDVRLCPRAMCQRIGC